MKLKKSGTGAIFLRSLINVVVTGLENRLLIPWFDLRLLKVRRPPPLAEPKRWFNGTALHYGDFMRCEDAIMDFNLCERDEKPDGSERRNRRYFKRGFLRVGDMVNPPQGRNLPVGGGKLSAWTSAQGKPPVADVVHQEETVFFDIPDGLNPALLLRQIYRLLHCLERLNVDPASVTLLFSNHVPRDGTLNQATEKLFNVCHFRDLHGVHLFRKFSCLVAGVEQGWQHGDASELLRRYMLPAFDLPPRRRSEDVNRITLVSRQDYKVHYGLNVLTRKISNEDEIIAVLRKNFPAAEVRAVRLEQLPVREQLRLVGETDVLIGMHGAALGYVALLPENAALLELFPLWFLKEHYFTTFYPVAVNGGVHYRRWINLNPSREYASEVWQKKHTEHLHGWARAEPRRDFVKVSPRAVLRRVRALQRRIRRGAG